MPENPANPPFPVLKDAYVNVCCVIVRVASFHVRVPRSPAEMSVEK